MAKSKGMPEFLQRMQQSTAARARNISHKGTAETFSVDLRNAPEPDRVYYAREAWAEFERGIVSLYFAQRRRDDEQKLRSLICVSLSPDNTARLVKSIDEMSDPGLYEIARGNDIQVEAVPSIPAEADQTVELSATLVRVAVSGHDSSMDFYKIPTQSLADAKLVGPSALKTVPQVRVDMRTSLLLGLVERLKELSNRFPKGKGTLSETE